MEIGKSVSKGLRTKVEVLDDRYSWVPENRDFTKESKWGDFGRSRLSGIGGFLPMQASYPWITCKITRFGRFWDEPIDRFVDRLVIQLDTVAFNLENLGTD